MKERTPLNKAAEKVRVEVAAKKGDLNIKALDTLTWHEAFTLAAIGEIVNPAPPASTYTIERFVYDSAQRTSNAFWFATGVIDDTLRDLREYGLIEMHNDIEAQVTPKGEKLLVRAAKEIQ